MTHILVGTFKPSQKTDTDVEVAMMRERNELMRQLTKSNIKYTCVNVKWIRNSFVVHGNNVHFDDKEGHYADGGYILNYKKFTLACSEVSMENKEVIHSPEERMNILKKMYGSNISILPPPDPRLNEHISPHIDITVLPIPERKILFVDSLYYYNLAKYDFDKAAKKYDLNLIITENYYKNPSYPCNSLVIKKEKNIAVVTNSVNTDKFKWDLKRNDIEIIEADFTYNCSRGGSIYSTTNIHPRLQEQRRVIAHLS